MNTYVNCYLSIIIYIYLLFYFVEMLLIFDFERNDDFIDFTKTCVFYFIFRLSVYTLCKVPNRQNSKRISK